MEMNFISDAQQQFYVAHKAITDSGGDYAALVYTLGIDDNCRQHFADLYDTKARQIKEDALHAAWQTSGSRKVTRLAFNLFTWTTPETDDPNRYAPKELFSGLDDTHKFGMIYALTYFA